MANGLTCRPYSTNFCVLKLRLTILHFKNTRKPRFGASFCSSKPLRGGGFILKHPSQEKLFTLNGSQLLLNKYLAPYVHRVAISDMRITSVNASSVSYTIRPSKSKATITRTISGVKFVKAFSQHILPKGFQKIRHYGWMSSNSKVQLEEVKRLVWLFLAVDLRATQPDRKVSQPQ